MVAASDHFAIINSGSTFWIEDELCIEKCADGAIVAHEQYVFGPKGPIPIRSQREGKRLPKDNHYI